MIRKLVFAGTTFLVLPASLATAHPGHGKVGDGQKLEHYLTEPVHLVAGIAILFGSIAVTMLWWKLMRSTRKSPNRQSPQKAK